MKYKYFVAYDWVKGLEQGVGSSQVEKAKVIDNYEDIMFIQEKIKKEYEYTNCVINNFILLSAIDYKVTNTEKVL